MRLCSCFEKFMLFLYYDHNNTLAGLGTHYKDATEIYHFSVYIFAVHIEYTATCFLCSTHVPTLYMSLYRVERKTKKFKSARHICKISSPHAADSASPHAMQCMHNAFFCPLKWSEGHPFKKIQKS